MALDTEMRLNAIFASATDETVEDCERIFTVTMLTKQDVVYELGDSAKSAFLIKRGRIRIVRPTPHGKEVTVAVLNSGSIFGEECLFGQQLRSTSAICMEDSVLCVARAADLGTLLLRYPQLTLNVAKILSSRLRDASASLEDLAYSKVRVRLMHLLDRLASEYGKRTSAGVVLDIRLTHSDLASLIGTTRETVTIELSGLRRLGRVRQSGRLLILPVA